MELDVEVNLDQFRQGLTRMNGTDFRASVARLLPILKRRVQIVFAISSATRIISASANKAAVIDPAVYLLVLSVRC